MDSFPFPHLEADNAEDSDIETDSDEEKDVSKETSLTTDDVSPPKPTRRNSNEPSKNDLGYDDSAPATANRYGYEDSAHTTSRRYEYDASRQPRRSSLRGPGTSRRSSIGSQGAKTIEVRVRGGRFPVTRRRSIDFARSVRVKEITPAAKLNENERELWLQGDDFKQMKEDRKKVVKSALRGNTKVEMRGLEKYVDKSIRQAKQVAWDTVLIEQDEQELAGNYSPEKLAEVYKHYTRESPMKAVNKAQEDQKQIEEYVDTPRTRRLMMRRLSC
jgi:hypothetical protein